MGRSQKTTTAATNTKKDFRFRIADFRVGLGQKKTTAEDAEKPQALTPHRPTS